MFTYITSVFNLITIKLKATYRLNLAFIMVFCNLPAQKENASTKVYISWKLKVCHN